jgi:hypothetical protein
MQKSVIILAALGVSAAAHAELLAPKGATAELEVKYVFTSTGDVTSSSKDQIDKWRVRREVSLAARYAADAPQPFGSLHKPDGKQQADMAGLKTRSANAKTKMDPMANDMVAIAARCGVTMTSGSTSKEQEACIEKAVSNYANNMQGTSEADSAREDISAMGQTMAGTRFQLWRLTSQRGTYSIDEEHHHQVFEMTCTASKVCRRDDIRKGAGNVPAPPGGRSVAGSSMVEIDTATKDAVITLPLPLAPLEYTQVVTSSIPGEQNSTKKTAAPPWMLRAAQPMTVSIPGNVANVSGTKTIPVEGKGADGGTITVTWQFTRQ